MEKNGFRSNSSFCFFHPSVLKNILQEIIFCPSGAVRKLAIALQMGKAYCGTAKSIYLEGCNSICGFAFQKNIFLLILEK